MSGSSSARCVDSSKKSRGRPPTYVWGNDEKLTEAEKRLKISIEKRRERQKKSYYKKKNEKQRQSQSPSAHNFPDGLLDDYGCSAASAASSKSSSRSPSPLFVVRDYYGYS